MKRSGPHNRFELENLEPRILLSADTAAALPCDLTDECESDLGTDLLPHIDEVAIGDEDRLEENSYQNQTTYDPSQSLDDIFAGLGEDDPTDLSEDENEFEDESESEYDGDLASEFEDEFEGEDDHDYSKGFEDENEDAYEDDDASASDSDESSYQDSVITSHQQDQIVRGLKALSRMGGVLEKFDAFGATITPTSDLTVGDFIGLKEILDTRLAKPVYDYFNDAVDPPDSQGVLQTIEQIPGDYGDLDITVDCLDGGVSPDGDVLQFDLKVNATRTGEVCAHCPADDLGENSHKNHTVIDLSADLKLDYSFGVDSTRSDEFFAAVRQFDAALSIESHGDDADSCQESVRTAPADGILNKEPEARISVHFADTITADGRITLDEIEAVTDETVEEFVDLAAAGVIFYGMFAPDDPQVNSVDPEHASASQPDPAEDADALLLDFTTDISGLKKSILDTFAALDEAGKTVVQSDDFDSPLPVINLSINQLLFDDPGAESKTAFDIHTAAQDYFVLLEAFNLDLTDELVLAKIGSLPEIGLADFNLENAAHKTKLKNLIESKFEVTIAPDWDINLYLPKIWSLLNEDFRISDYLPTFQLLLGLPYVPKMDEVRSDLKSYFGSFPTLKGLLDFIRTTNLDPLFSDFEGRTTTEPFKLSGEYIPDTDQIRFDFAIDAIRQIDFAVDLERLFPDRFRELGISFDSDPAFTLTLGLKLDFSATISGEDGFLTMREASVTVQVNEQIDGPGVTVENLPESNFAVSGGRFDFDSRVELVFHGLDPPAAGTLTLSDLLNASTPDSLIDIQASGTLSLELPITSQDPTRPILIIYVSSDSVFDPSPLTLSAHLVLSPEDPNQTIGIGGGAPGDFNLSQETLDLLDGFDTITVGAADGSHLVEIGSAAGAVTFSDPMVISTPNEGGEVWIRGDVIGSDDASLTILGSGHTTNIGNGSDPYPNTTVSQNAGITINDSIVLHGNIRLVADNGDITIGKTGGVIEGDNDGDPDTLTISAGGKVTILGLVGGNGLRNLIIEKATDVTFQNGVTLTGGLTINATGAVDLNGAVQVPGGFSSQGILFDNTDAPITIAGGPIAAATNASPIVISSNGHGLADDDLVLVEGVKGNTASNGTFKVTGAQANTFQLGPAAGNGTYTPDTGSWYGLNLITGATGDSPIVIRSANHGLENDDWVWIEGAGGVITANGLHQVKKGGIGGANANDEFTLTGVDGLGAAYTANTGTWVKVNRISGATNTSLIVIDSAGHGLANNDWVLVQGVEGNIAANGVFQVLVGGDDHGQFYLDGSDGRSSGVYKGNTGMWFKVRPITVATNASPIVITAAAHGLLADRDYRLRIQGVEGNTAANGDWTVRRTGIDTFRLNAGAGNDTHKPGSGTWSKLNPITGATSGLPITITSNGHGLKNDNRVRIQGVGGNTAANGIFTVTRVDDNRFYLNGSDGFGADPHVAGTGSWVKLPAITIEHTDAVTLGAPLTTAGGNVFVAAGTTLTSTMKGRITTEGGPGSPGTDGGEVLLRSTGAGDIILSGGITADGAAGAFEGDNGGNGGVVTVRNDSGSIKLGGISTRKGTSGGGAGADGERGIVQLSATSTISQYPFRPIEAEKLKLIATGGEVTLDYKGNDVNILAADLSGASSLTYVDKNALTIGTVARAGTGNADRPEKTGVVAAGANAAVLVKTQSDNMTVSAVVTTNAGDVTLNAKAGALLLNAAFTTSGGNATLSAGGEITSTIAGTVTTTGRAGAAGGSAGEVLIHSSGLGVVSLAGDIAANGGAGNANGQKGGDGGVVTVRNDDGKIQVGHIDNVGGLGGDGGAEGADGVVELLSATGTITYVGPDGDATSPSGQVFIHAGHTVELPGQAPWLEQGPSIVQSPGGMGSLASLGINDANSGFAGAVQTIAVHPKHPDVVYVGTVNGGVWKTDNINRTVEQDTLNEVKTYLGLAANEVQRISFSADSGRFRVKFQPPGEGSSTGVVNTAPGSTGTTGTADAAAHVTITSPGPNNDLTFRATGPGTGLNNVKVEYVNGDAAGAVYHGDSKTLTITVIPGVTTAADVIAKVEDVDEFEAIAAEDGTNGVINTAPGTTGTTGSNEDTAYARITSPGQNNDLTFIATATGTALNDVTVEYVNGDVAGAVYHGDSKTLTITIVPGVTTAADIIKLMGGLAEFKAIRDFPEQKTAEFPFNVRAQTLQAALEGFDGINAGDVLVEREPPSSGKPNEQIIKVTFTGSFGGKPISKRLELIDVDLKHGQQSLGKPTIRFGRPQAGKASKDTVYLVDYKATEGNFALTFRGGSTVPVAFDASAEDVKSALENLEVGDEREKLLQDRVTVKAGRSFKFQIALKEDLGKAVGDALGFNPNPDGADPLKMSHPAPVWMPLTDMFPSLPIGAMAFDDLEDPKTLFVGTGNFSNANNGGLSLGLLKLELAESGAVSEITMLGEEVFAGLQITKILPVVVEGTIELLVATTSSLDFYEFPSGLLSKTKAGLFRGKIDGQGKWAFDRVKLGNLEFCKVSDLVAISNPNQPGKSILFAAVAERGIYRSDNNGGTWTQVNNGLSGVGSATHIRFAVHDNVKSDPSTRALYVGLVGGLINERIKGMYRTTDFSANLAWTSMNLPADVNTGTWIKLYPVTGATNTSLIVITSPGHGLASNDWVLIEGVEGNTAANGRFQVLVSRGENDQFYLKESDGRSSGVYKSNTGTWIKLTPITDATNASPIVITSAAHGLNNGDQVQIEGVGGNTAANGQFIVTSVTANTFSLIGTAGNGNYTASTGTWTKFNPITDATNKSPIVITSNGHGLRNGDRVRIQGVGGNEAANGIFTVKPTRISGNNRFSLNGSQGDGDYHKSDGLHPGGQGVKNFSFVADPNHPNVVFVGGDRQPYSPYVARIFRGTFGAGANGSTVWEEVVKEGANGTAPHADSRMMIFSQGSILESDDGGIYRLSSPHDAAKRRWQSVNGNLAVFEVNSISYDPIRDVYFVGTQDNGSLLQDEKDPILWHDILGGDGNTTDVAIIRNEATGLVEEVRRYVMSNTPKGFYVYKKDSKGRYPYGKLGVRIKEQSFADVYTFWDGKAEDSYMPVPYAVNAVNPDRIMLGRIGLYELTKGQDGKNSIKRITPLRYRFIPLSVGGTWTPLFSAIDFGGMKDGEPAENVAYITHGSKIAFGVATPESTGSGFNWSFTFSRPGGASLISDIVMDPEDYRIAYAVDRNAKKVFMTTDTGKKWVDITAELTLQRPSSVEIVKAHAGLLIWLRAGYAVEVPLDGARTVRDLITLVGDHSNGKVTVERTGKRLKFTDTSEGTGIFAIETLNLSPTVLDLFGSGRSAADPGEALLTPELLNADLADDTPLNGLDRQDPDNPGKGIRRVGKDVLLVGGVEGVYRAIGPFVTESATIKPTGKNNDFVISARKAGPDFNKVNARFTTTDGAASVSYSAETKTLEFKVKAGTTRAIDLISLLKEDAEAGNDAGSYFSAVLTDLDGGEENNGSGVISSAPRSVKTAIAASDLKWTEFGTGLPNALVTSISYTEPLLTEAADKTIKSIGNVLTIGTLGRGAWKIADPRAILLQEPVLRITGTAEADTVELRKSPMNQLLVDLLINNKLRQSFERSSIQRIELKLGGGDDIAIVDDETIVPGGLRIIGGDGFDRLEILDGDDRDAIVLLRKDPASPGHVLLGTPEGDLTIAFDGVETLNADDVATAEVSPLMAIRIGLDETFDSSTDWLPDGDLALVGGSLEPGLNGIDPDQPQPIGFPAAENAPQGLTEGGSAGGQILRRIFEASASGFRLEDIGTTITTLEQLREELDALDDITGNVILSMVDGFPRFDVQVIRTLAGTTDLDIADPDGDVSLQGSVDIRADVRVHIVFGVDAGGFYIDPSAPEDGSGNAEPELIVGNIQMGEEIDATGLLGFLTATFTEATFTVDPGVLVTVDLVEPGSDPFTSTTDGLIRTYELFPFDYDLVATSVQDSPLADDLTLSGTVDVEAVTPLEDESFSLPDAGITLTWPDITDPSNFSLTISEDTDSGKLLSKLFDMDMDDLLLPLLQEIEEVGGSILTVSALDSDLPYIEASVNDLLSSPESAGVGDLLQVHDAVAGFLEKAEANNDHPSFTEILDVVTPETSRKLSGSEFDGTLIQKDGRTLLMFDVVTDILEVSEFTVDLADYFSYLGVSTPVQVRVESLLTIDFSFGLDLTDLLSGGTFDSADAFFELRSFSAEAILDLSEFSRTGDLVEFPFTVENATATMVRGAMVAFKDTSPAVNGRIYYTDLSSGDFSSLFDVVQFAEQLDRDMTVSQDDGITLDDSIVIDGNARLEARNGDIIIGEIGGTIEGNDDDNPDTLTINAGGNVTIRGHVGGDGLQDLIIEKANSVTFDNGVTLTGNLTSSATGAVIIDGRIEMSAGGAITIRGPIRGDNDGTPDSLGLKADGSIVLHGAVGTGGLSALTLKGGAVDLNAEVNVTDGFSSSGTNFDNTGAPVTIIDRPITDVTSESPIVITSEGHGLKNGERVQIKGVEGDPAANGTFTVRGAQPNSFQLGPAAGNGTYTPNTGSWYGLNLITGATGDDPIVITSANHGLANNDWVWIEGVGGVAAANGLHQVKKGGIGGANANDEFTLTGVDGLGAAYTPNTGSWMKVKRITGATNTSLIVITSEGHGLADNDWVLIQGVEGNTAANGVFQVLVGSDNGQFYLNGSDGRSSGVYTNDTGMWIKVKPITGATNATPIAITSNGHGFQGGETVRIERVGGNTAANGTFIVAADSADVFSLTRPAGTGTYKADSGTWIKLNPITSATNAEPIVITSNGHGLADGDRVWVRGVGGNTAANGTHTVIRKTDDTFSLEGTKGNGAYAAGTGTWIKLNPITINHTGVATIGSPIITTGGNVTVAAGTTITSTVAGMITTTGLAGNPGTDGGEVLIHSTGNGAVRLEGNITASGAAGAFDGDNGGNGGLVTVLNADGSITVGDITTRGGTSGGGGGVGGADGTVQLSATTTISQHTQKAINAGNLKLISTGGDVTLANSDNNVATLAAALSGASSLTYGNAAALTIGTVPQAGTGQANLEEKVGVVTAGADASISVAAQSKNLTVSNVVTTNAGNVTLSAKTGALAVNAAIASSGGKVTLTAGAGITSTAAGTVTTNGRAGAPGGPAGEVLILSTGLGGVSLAGDIAANGGDANANGQNGGDGGVVTVRNYGGEIQVGEIEIENMGGAGGDGGTKGADGAVELSATGTMTYPAPGGPLTSPTGQVFIQGDNVVELPGQIPWVAQGPSIMVNNQSSLIISNLGRNDENSIFVGAIQAIAVHPDNLNIVYVGTVNGGVWKTTDINRTVEQNIQTNIKKRLGRTGQNEKRLAVLTAKSGSFRIRLRINDSSDWEITEERLQVGTTAQKIQEALEKLKGIGANNVKVSIPPSSKVVKEGQFAFEVEFIGERSNTRIEKVSLFEPELYDSDDKLIEYDPEGDFRLQLREISIGKANENTSYTISINATEGYYTLIFRDDATRALPFDANPDDIKTALEEDVAVLNGNVLAVNKDKWTSNKKTYEVILKDPLGTEDIDVLALDLAPAGQEPLKLFLPAPQWTPLTDMYPSLSIGAMAFDPNDPNILYVGTGNFSSGGIGGLALGLLKIDSSGAEPVVSILGEEVLNGRHITSIVPLVVNEQTGETRLFISSTSGGIIKTKGGLFQGTIDGDGEWTFERVKLNLLDFTYQVSDLVSISDQSGKKILFAAVHGFIGAGIYRSGDYGASWSKVNNGLSNVAFSADIRLAVHDSTGNNPRALYAGLTDSSGGLLGLYRTEDVSSGLSWTSMLPTTTEGKKYVIKPGDTTGFKHFAMAADPDNPNVVFIGGDTFGKASHGKILLGTFGDGENGGTLWKSVVSSGANNTAPHADSRFMAFIDMGAYFVRTSIQGLNTQSVTITAGSPDFRDWEALGKTRSFTIKVEGVEYTVNPDFTGVTRMDGATIDTSVAYRIWDALEDATSFYTMSVEYKPLTQQFIITDKLDEIQSITDPPEGLSSLFGRRALLESDDGGIYRLLSPNDEVERSWQSLNGNLAITEMYSLSYDPLREVAFAGTQDNGSLVQAGEDSVEWNNVLGGDGNDTAVAIIKDKNGLVTEVLRFVMSQKVSDLKVNPGGDLTKAGKEIKGVFDAFGWVDKSNAEGFTRVTYAVNAVNPNKILLGRYGLFELIGVIPVENEPDVNPLVENITGTILPDLSQIDPDLTQQPGFWKGIDYFWKTKAYWWQALKAGKNNPIFRAVAYGGMKDGNEVEDIAYVAYGKKIGVRKPGNPDFTFNAPGGASLIFDIVMDPEDYTVAYAVDRNSRKVYRTNDTGSTWKDITGDLKLQRPSSVEIIKADGKDILLVGGVDGVYRAFDPLTSSKLHWTEFGTGLPNAEVTTVSYTQPMTNEKGESIGDVLMAGTFGRGAWKIADPRNLLAQEPILRITGTGGNDRIELNNNPDNPLFFDLSINDTFKQSFQLSNIQRIEIELGEGEDTAIIYDKIQVPDRIHIKGGAGFDVLKLRDDKKKDAVLLVLREPQSPGHALLGTPEGDVMITFDGVETLNTSDVATPQDNPLMAIRIGLDETFDSSTDWLPEGHLALLGDSLEPALNGIDPEQPQPIGFPAVENAPQALEQGGSAGGQILRRIFETSPSGFRLADVGTTITTPADILLGQFILHGSIFSAKSGRFSRFALHRISKQI